MLKIYNVYISKFINILKIFCPALEMVVFPIPKTRNDASLHSELTIMLVEILRKYWIGLIVYHINSS